MNWVFKLIKNIDQWNLMLDLLRKYKLITENSKIDCVRFRFLQFN
jgi:hypothetical protein